VGNDLATVGINRQMQLSPATAGLCSMLFFQPLACAIDLQPGAIGQNRLCRKFLDWLQKRQSLDTVMQRGLRQSPREFIIG